MTETDIRLERLERTVATLIGWLPGGISPDLAGKLLQELYGNTVMGVPGKKKMGELTAEDVDVGKNSAEFLKKLDGEQIPKID